MIPWITILKAEKTAESGYDLEAKRSISLNRKIESATRVRGTPPTSSVSEPRAGCGSATEGIACPEKFSTRPAKLSMRREEDVPAGLGW